MQVEISKKYRVMIKLMRSDTNSDLLTERHSSRCAQLRLLVGAIAFCMRFI
jgi:hypothetical protein